MHKLLGSSQDPEKLALSIKGALLTLIPIIVAIAGGLQVTLDGADMVSLVNTLFGIFTLCLTAIGLVRKIYTSFKK